MWRTHMGLHAQGLFHGDIPREWLQEQGLYICECQALVAISRLASHLRKCACIARLAAPSAPIPSHSESKHSFTIF